jgi:hypothetical protein
MTRDLGANLNNRPRYRYLEVSAFSMGASTSRSLKVLRDFWLCLHCASDPSKESWQQGPCGRMLMMPTRAPVSDRQCLGSTHPRSLLLS